MRRENEVGAHSPPISSAGWRSQRHAAGAITVDGNDLAVRPGAEALDGVSVVLKTDDEVGEERLCVAVRDQGCLHRAVLLRELDGGHGSLRSSAPLTAEPPFSLAQGVSAARYKKHRSREAGMTNPHLVL